MTYSKFINGLNTSGIKLDRKVLADIAYNDPEAFKSIVKKVQNTCRDNLLKRKMKNIKSRKKLGLVLSVQQEEVTKLTQKKARLAKLKQKPIHLDNKRKLHL